MPKMARNRSALHDVLAQGASNRDITVFRDTPSNGVSTEMGALTFCVSFLFAFFLSSF